VLDDLKLGGDAESWMLSWTKVRLERNDDVNSLRTQLLKSMREETALRASG
jgi:hypothetical protein